MDHLGVRCSSFYKLQEKACAQVVLEQDVKGALGLFTASQSNGNVDESDYLRNAVRFWLHVVVPASVQLLISVTLLVPPKA